MAALKDRTKFLRRYGTIGTPQENPPISISALTSTSQRYPQHNAMPSPLNQDKEEQLLTSVSSEQVHDSNAMMEEGGGSSKNHEPSSVALPNDDAKFSLSNATSVSHASSKIDTTTTIDDVSDKSDEEVSGESGTKEIEEESMLGARATTATCKSTNEEDGILPFKELSTKSDNDSDDGSIFGATADRHGVDAAVEDYMGEKEGENHSVCALELDTGKSNESALQIVATGNDSNHHHRRPYNQSFVSSLTQSHGTFTRSSRNEKQDEYVKKGARVKALLASALQAVSDGIASRAGSSTAVDGSDNDGNELDSKGKSKQTNADYKAVQDLAQKKSEECITLKRKLEESQLQIQCLHNECSTSERNASQTQSKIDRTLEALKIAGANAANARAEADAANARAESLNGQLNDLQAVIEDTKNSMEIVRREHDEVSHAARSVEGRLIQVESELTRAAKVKRDAEEERDVLKIRADKSEKLASELQDKVNDYEDEIRHLKRDMVEMDELEKMRSDRTQRIESELQDARVGLMEATSAAAEAESTVTSLRSVIEELRRDNESLHTQIDEGRNAVSKERAKQNEVLTLAEKEAQKWRLKFEESDEENRKLRMDKATADKQVDQLKLRLTNLERRVNDSNKQGHLKSGVTPAMTKVSTAAASEKNPVVTPKNASDLEVIYAFGSKDVSSSGTESGAEEGNKRKYVSELPRREQPKNPPDSYSRQLTYSTAKSRKEKENDPNKSASSSRDNKRPKKVQSNICCLCNREGGMILRCQCDNINCEARAHPMCLGKFRLGKADSAKTILCSNGSARAD